LSIISEIYYKKIYDVKEIKTYGCIYDVGAHVGLSTLRISKQAPKRARLKDRVRGLNVVAGQRKGRAVLWLSKLSRGDSSIKKWHNVGSAGYLMVDVLPLDDILSNESSCNLIKIDVEGAETEVLRGLEKQHVKVNRLVIEIHTSVVNVNEIYKWIHNHGFVVTKTKKLYEDCLLLEAQRPCA
jgi:FkbM family methyltransferase